MIGIEDVVRVFMYLVGCGLIFGLLFWLVGYIGIPEPWNKAIRVFLAVCAVLLLIGLILQMMGHPVIRF